MFACEHEGVEPDVMTLGKGLTGGYLPVAATLVADEIYDAFWGDFAELRTFFHGHSFTGNQLGCAVALASLDLFERGPSRRARRRRRAASSRVCSSRSATLRHVGDVRQRGLMVGIGSSRAVRRELSRRLKDRRARLRAGARARI